MKTGNDLEQLKKFKPEATEIMEDVKFTVHKWESDVQALDNEANPSSMLGHSCDKREDILEIAANVPSENKSWTKRVILSQLSSIYDPLGIISPTVVEGKRIYREVCDEKGGWNSEVPAHIKRDWIRWTR